MMNGMLTRRAVLAVGSQALWSDDAFRDLAKRLAAIAARVPVAAGSTDGAAV